MKPALYGATATKTVQAATVNKSLQFRRLLRDFFAPVWGLPLVAVYVPVHDKIRSESFAVAANISRRSGGAFTRVNQTRPQYVNQMGKTHSQPLAARMYELAFTLPVHVYDT